MLDHLKKALPDALCGRQSVDSQSIEVQHCKQTPAHAVIHAFTSHQQSAGAPERRNGRDFVNLGFSIEIVSFQSLRCNILDLCHLFYAKQYDH
jgi:hypothetical protein